MPEIHLSQAITDIVSCAKGLRRPGQAGPYFFVVGAGISAGSVPLAGEMVRMLESEYPDQTRHLLSQPLSARERYILTFEAACPDPALRQVFLHRCVHGKPVPPAVQRLAHLLGSERFGSIVVTPNFDEFISQTLRTFGHDVVICDHPATAGRIEPNRSLLQVVHVHGTHWFYDTCNLRVEIEARAKARAHEFGGMASLLDWILKDQAPIVLGYSGWEGDVIMTALRRALWWGEAPQQRKQHLYWFCYTRADARLLPEWLVAHPNVRIVVPEPPPAPAPRPPSVDSGTGGLGMATLGQMPLEPAERVLSAQAVLEALIRQGNVELPELFRDPFSFYASAFKHRFQSPPEDDLYRLGDLVLRFEDAAQWDKTQERHRATREQIVRAVAEQRYAEAVNLSESLEPADLRDEDLLVIAAQLSETWWAERNNNALALRAAEAELRFARAVRDPVRAVPAVLWARLDRAAALDGLGRNEEALAEAEAVLVEVGAQPPPALSRHRLRALHNAGAALLNGERYAEARARLISFFAEFPGVSDTRTRDLAICAHRNMAVALGAEPATRAGVQVHVDALDEACRGESAELARELLAEALSRIGFFARDQGEVREARRLFEEILRRFSMDDPNSAVQRSVVEALLECAAQLAQSGDFVAANGQLDRIICIPLDDINRERSEATARALRNKGVYLRDMGNAEEAIQTWELLLRTFSSDDPNTSIREQVVAALYLLGQQLDRLGDWTAANRWYDDLISMDFECAPQVVRKRVAVAHYNKGKNLLGLGDKVAARQVLEQMCLRFSMADTSVLVREAVGASHVARAIQHRDAGDLLAANEVYEQFLSVALEDSAPELRKWVAIALREKGGHQRDLGDTENATRTWELLLARFSIADPDVKVREHVAAGLVNLAVLSANAGDLRAANQRYDQILAGPHDDASPELRQMIARALRYTGSNLKLMGDAEGERRAWEQLIAEFSLDDPNTAIREHVAVAHVDLGVHFAKSGDRVSANQWFDRLVAATPDDMNSGVRTNVALALLNKGINLREAGDASGAAQTFELLLTRFTIADPVPGVRQKVASALVERGFQLHMAGDLSAAIQYYDQLISAVADEPDPEVLERVAAALFNKATCLRNLGQPEQAAQTWEQFLLRFSMKDASAKVRKWVAEALVTRGFRLVHAGDLLEANRRYDQLIDAALDDTTPGVPMHVAQALRNKGVNLRDLGDVEGATRTWEQLLARFSLADEDPTIRNQVGFALVERALQAGNAGDLVAANQYYDQLIRAVQDDTDPEMRARVALALRNKGVNLRDLGDAEGAAQTWDQLISLFSLDDLNPDIREQVAVACLERGARLGNAGDRVGANRHYDQLIDAALEDTAPGVEAQIALALRNKGLNLRDLGDAEGAEQTWERLLARFSLDDPQPVVREQVAVALLERARIWTQADRWEEAAQSNALVADALGGALSHVEPRMAAIARGNLAEAWMRLGRVEDALAAVDALLAEGVSLDADVRFSLTGNRAEALLRLGRKAESGALYAELFSAAPMADPTLRREVAAALADRTLALRALGFDDEAITSNEDLQRHFAGEEDPVVQRHLLRATPGLTDA